jgi:creatinine amidohydrolase
MSADPLGFRLLAERVAEVPVWLATLFAGCDELGTRNPESLKRVVATGIGSSEAQARYFVWLLNHCTDVPAVFAPLGSLAEGPSEGTSQSTLAVFSQGLSSNAALVLNQAKYFAKTLVFTAATPEGQRRAGRVERAQLLAWLNSIGAEIIPFPIEDEYTILIRMIGPACGFVAAYRFVASLARTRLPPLAVYLPWLTRFSSGNFGAPLVEAIRNDPETWKPGGLILLPAPLLEFCQNVSYKFVEGLFWPPPQLVDMLQFSHGPFQQLAAQPRPVCILRGISALDIALADRACAMLTSIGIDPLVVNFDAPSVLGPIALELLFNPMVQELVGHFGIDQVNWPGKGLDGPLYHFAVWPPNPHPT